MYCDNATLSIRPLLIGNNLIIGSIGTSVGKTHSPLCTIRHGSLRLIKCIGYFKDKYSYVLCSIPIYFYFILRMENQINKCSYSLYEIIFYPPQLHGRLYGIIIYYYLNGSWHERVKKLKVNSAQPI